MNENGKRDRSQSPPAAAFNPSDEEDDVDPELAARLKGDAIGDTLYSARYILNTLMKLPQLDKPLSEDKDYEKDLETLWDQTVAKDVVKYILELGVLDIFGVCLNEEDGRLTEILIGIIANMCVVPETIQTLVCSADNAVSFINLISSTDSLVLVQLMRFYGAVLAGENDELEWFEHFYAADNFVEKFSFVLKNSTSKTLLRHSMSALNSMCVKFSGIETNIQDEKEGQNFVEMFVVPSLIEGLIEAFKTVVGTLGDGEPTDDVAKFMNNFLDVCVILSQYDEVSLNAFSNDYQRILGCIVAVLKGLCEPSYLFPVSTETRGIIQNTSDIVEHLLFPWHRELWMHVLKIFTLIYKEKTLQENGSWTTEDSSELNLGTQIMSNLLDTLILILKHNSGLYTNGNREIDFEIDRLPVNIHEIADNEIFKELLDLNMHGTFENGSIEELTQSSLKTLQDLVKLSLENENKS